MSGPTSETKGGTKAPTALRAFVVSHSHWDRAWYLPFEGYRFQLARMIDEVLAILRDDPRFASFTLDGQTAALEDYLEVRPERRAEIAAHVASGRLVIGPCFVLPDEYLVSGEALVRNLQRGLATVREFGGECRDGYMPDSFGHVAQMPQILAGFGLRSFLFMRGVSEELFARAGVEFAWEAPDGTRVLGLYLRGGYDNAALLGHPEKWGNFRGRVPEVPLAAQRLKEAVDQLKGHARSGVLLLCNGSDHLMPQREIPDLLASAKSELPRIELLHSTFGAAVDAVLASRKDFTVHRGELLGNAHHPILSSTWSARIDMKVENHEVQDLLEKHAEPLAAALGPRAGREHAARLDRAWRDLLLTHPHDDVCGCSVDSVHEDGRFRLRQARHAATAVVHDALRALALRTGFTRKDGIEVLGVHNPHFEAWSGTVACIVQWPSALSDEDLDTLALIDPDGKPVRVHVERLEADAFTAHHLDYRRGALLSVEFAAKLPACGIAFYQLVRGAPGPQGFDDVVAGGVIENENLRVEARHDGSLAILHKASGKRLDGALIYESRSDRGDLYSFGPDAETDPAWSTGKGIAKVQAWRSATAAHMSISIVWKLPWIEPKERELLALRIETLVRLEDGSARLEFETMLDTELTNHRVRVLLPLPAGTKSLTTDQAFALVQRERTAEVTPEQAPDRWKGYPGELPYTTQFSGTFVHAADPEAAVVVAHRGLHEHEIVDAPAGSNTRGEFLALTLWRGVGTISREGGRIRRCQAGPSLATPDAQRPPIGLVVRSAWEVVPGTETQARVAARAATFAHPPLAEQVWIGAHERGGSERISARRSFLRCDDPRVALSALRVEADGVVLVRVWNRSPETVRTTLQLGPDIAGPRPPKSARRVRLDGLDLGPVELTGTIARLELGPAAIQTIAFHFEANP
ncbi:MAG: hypothetical protein NTY35_13410 [Planctomycetota bacterium]|nr:hypothetical protein [Planctomycetota bacterium]